MPDPTPEMLATPTLGAWHRTHGTTGWSEEARHLYATLAVQEAQRRLLAERLTDIVRFLDVGATPDQAMHRITRLVADWYSR